MIFVSYRIRVYMLQERYTSSYRFVHGGCHMSAPIRWYNTIHERFSILTTNTRFVQVHLSGLYLRNNNITKRITISID